MAWRRSASSSTTYLVRRPGPGDRVGARGSFGRELLAPFQNGLIQFYAAVTALGVAGLLLDPAPDDVTADRS